MSSRPNRRTYGRGTIEHAARAFGSYVSPIAVTRPRASVCAKPGPRAP
jgi:hypothetical protein